MSSTKRPLVDNGSLNQPTKKAKALPRRQVVEDTSKPPPMTSKLRRRPNGRVGVQRIKLDVENVPPPGSLQPQDDQMLPSETTSPLLPSCTAGLAQDPIEVAKVPTEDTGGVTKKRRKREYTNKSKLSKWLLQRETYLLELLRGYGLGDNWNDTTCATCRSMEGRFRCVDCFPRSQLRCSKCFVTLHQENPLHRVEEWDGTFFRKTQACDLGLTVQLGHGGRSCPCPTAGPSDFVVFHVNGVHRVNIAFCDCGSLNEPAPHARVQLLRMGWFPASSERPKTVFTFDLLRLFHKVTLQGKTTLYDFYHAILQVTDSLELDKISDHYKEFNHVFRLWRHLAALKHAGRAHDPSGAAGTSEGELVIECPACPHPGKNLPENWEEAAPQDRFLYTFFLAFDANFKLKQKDRGIRDIELGPGWGCYVEASQYEKHIALHVDEPEINTCGSDHNAVTRANTAVPGTSVYPL